MSSFTLAYTFVILNLFQDNAQGSHVMLKQVQHDELVEVEVAL